MNILPVIEASTDELTDIFKDLHTFPEIGMEEERTSAIVAEKLKAYGVDEVHTGIGNTGVVGIVHGKGKGGKRIGLRADMDALPIDEQTNLPYSSKNSGKMHACGHDGHTTMLLGAAKHLAETRNFDGTAVLIFQPAEEGLGGARGMLADGLFDRFPCDEVYGMHNSPNGEPGTVGICKGAAMAGASFFDITVTGRGSHAAMPQQSRDALVIASSLVGQLQTIVSRNVAPLDSCVLSVTQIHAGSAYNVVPETAHLCGTIRYFKDEVYETAERRVKELCEGMAHAYGVEITADLRNVFDVLMNDADLSDAYMDAARDIVGDEMISRNDEPATGSEDFADMLKVVPGAYCRVGHTGTVPLHNPGFVLGTEILPVGASIMARVVERRMPLSDNVAEAAG
ncbi:M20 aminoacylase family protein [Thalassovita mangrovi]|uniref:Amidohydrolase n=1 Tax=Thalassovita mangrovi TaxID=2692236 RepID=A0A6L8LQH8_9RHOB|nr:M20 aminoacylase family protein [Thalassovita mangrovi]MYM56830.1 amidohydrolase [Thalassovita mangrovi]